MAQRQQGQGIWIPPLPHGWEARYDQNQKRYFFLHHSSKKTQWEDPRFTQAQPTAASAASSLAAHSHTRQSHASRHNRAGEAVQMQELSPSRGSHSQRSHHQEESSLSSQANLAVINKIHKDFPKATKELITDMFQLCHENERETREQLQDLGFLKETTARSPQRSAQSSGHRSSQSREAAQPAAQPKPQISDYEKRMIANDLKFVFPKLDLDVIQMALSTCNFDKESTKTLLEAWEARNASSNATTNASATTSSSGSTSTSRVSPPHVTTVTVSSEPAGQIDLEERRPVSSRREASPAASTSSQGQRPGQSASTSSQGQRQGQRASTSSQGQRQGQSAQERLASASQISARQVTKMSENLLNTTSDLLNSLATSANCCPSNEASDGSKEEQYRRDAKKKKTVVTAQPTTRQVTPKYHSSTASGPDANLRKGPDSSLLRTEYEEANGPDNSLRQGTDRFRVSGPSGANGSDPSLRCGPQSCLLQKNGLETLGGVLITQI